MMYQMYFIQNVKYVRTLIGKLLLCFYLCSLICFGTVAYAFEGEDACAKVIATLYQESGKKEEYTNSRQRFLSDTAKTYGFQSGFAYKYGLYRKDIDANAMEFAKIFDFRRLLLDARVLPPVIMEAGPTTTLDSNTLARTSVAEYRIIAPARIVGEPPTYLSYFICPMDVVPVPSAFLPKTDAEKKLWKESVEEGWKEGLEHATQVFDTRMQKLVADYRGILLFMRLHRQGYVSLPILAHGAVGIQVQDTVLTMDEEIFRITQHARFTKSGE